MVPETNSLIILLLSYLPAFISWKVFLLKGFLHILILNSSNALWRSIHTSGIWLGCKEKSAAVRPVLSALCPKTEFWNFRLPLSTPGPFSFPRKENFMLRILFVIVVKIFDNKLALLWGVAQLCLPHDQLFILRWPLNTLRRPTVVLRWPTATPR